jgi:hypothetical protein
MALHFPLMIVQMQHSIVSRPVFLQKTAAFYISAGRRNIVDPALVTVTAQFQVTILTGCGPQAVSFVTHDRPPVSLLSPIFHYTPLEEFWGKGMLFWRGRWQGQDCASSWFLKRLVV